MNSEYLLYLQEIKNTEWVVELISEQFDDAMNMMTPNSVIYGGAVRDCLAGKDLIGDLDIAVSASECTTMINKFVKNPKWVKISNKCSGAHYKKFGLVSPFFGEPQRIGASTKTPQIMTFKTLGNKTVQIIILKPTGSDPFQTVTTMVKQVDIVCCGVILTNDNKVFEVVPNAYKECKKHVLHLNNTCYVKDIENFKQRIEKLSERGWINEINITKVIRTVNRRHKQNLKNKKGIAEISKHSSINLEKEGIVDTSDQKAITEEGYITLRGPYTPQEGATGSEMRFYHAEGTDTLTHTGYRSILSNRDIRSIGGMSSTMYSLDSIAKKYRLDIIIQPVKNFLIIITKNRYVSDQVITRVMGPATRSPLVSKHLEGAAHLYTETAKTTMKKKYKLSISDSDVKAIDPPYFDAVTNWKGVAQRHGKIKPTIPPISSNKRKGFSGAITERYFNYSTATESKAITTTTTIDKYHRGIFKSDIALIGGIAMLLVRLERIAKKYKIDIGIIAGHSTTTLITIDEYTSRQVYNEVLNKVPYTKSSGGAV